MEKSKKIDLSDRPIDRKNWGEMPSCPYFIFGDKKSADKDLKKIFNVVK